MILGPVLYWFIAGLILFIIEFFIAPSVGILFLSLGAFSNAGIIHVHPSILNKQFINFAAFSGIYLIIFAHAYNHFRCKKKTPTVDIIGTTVVVYKTIEPGKFGEVKWSGTIMNAILDMNARHTVYPGEIVKVSHIQGNILICTKIIP